MKNKKGFTLIELLGVIILLGILTTIATVGYSGYLSSTKNKTFAMEEKNFISATQSAYSDCISNNTNNDFCYNHKTFENKYTYQLVYLKELIDDQYFSAIKDPYDIDKFCDVEKSYVYTSLKNDPEQNNNSNMVYKACLVCGNHQSKDCLDETVDYSSFDTTCKAYFDTLGGDIYDGSWTDRTVVLDFGASGNFRYGIDNFVYTVNNMGNYDIDASNNMAQLILNKTGNGDYKVQAYDGMNKKGTTASCGVVRVDKASINSVSLSAIGSSGNKLVSNTWVNEQVTLEASVNPSESLSGYVYQWYFNGEKYGNSTLSNKLVVEKSGTYKVEVTNQVGKIKKMSNEFIVKLDNVVAPIIQGGSNIWLTQAPTISIKTVGSAASGVKHYEYYKTNSTDLPTVATQATGTTDNTLKVADNGTTYIYYRTVSNGGNRSSWTSAQVVNLETVTLPVIQGGSNNWVTTARTISIKTASNPASGVKHYEYYKTNSTDLPTVATQPTGTTSNSITVSDLGTTYIYYRAVSNGGNKSSWTSAQVVNFEVVNPPTITGGNSNAWVAAAPTISIATVGSATSGVRHYEYYKSTSNVALNASTQATGITSNSVQITDNKTSYIYYRTVSNGGNKSNWTSAQVVNLDTIKPTLTSNLPSGVYNSSDRTVTFTASDNESGIQAIQYEVYLGGTKKDANSYYSTSKSFDLNSHGIWNIYIKTLDNAGNWDNGGNWNQYTYTIDTQPPTCSLKASGTQLANGWYTSDVTIAWASLDGTGSNIDQRLSSISNTYVTAEGPTTVTASVTDQAGHIGTCSITVYIEKTVNPPTITTSGNSNAWVSTTPTISIATAGSAASGVAHYEYYTSYSTETPSAGTAASGTTNNNVTISYEGITYTWYRTVSNAGQRSAWSGLQVTNLDTKKPTTPILQKTPADSYTASDIVISLKMASSATSGIAYYEYWDGLGSPDSPYATLASGTTTNTYTITGKDNGNKYGDVYYRAISNSGLASSWASISYVIDRINPRINSVTGTSTTWSNSKTITIDPIVPFSGIKKFCYYVSNSYVLSSNAEPTSCETSNTFTVTEPGKYIFFELISGAGNSSGISSAHNLYVGSSSRNASLYTVIFEDNPSIYTTITTLQTSSNKLNDANGLYKSTNTASGNPTYFFRGNVTNNYVSFAGFIWRIVRVNEDGTIRIILNDTINNGTSYKFINSPSSTIDMYYSNSNAKSVLDSWYTTNISNRGYATNVVTGNYFCEENIPYKTYSSKSYHFKCTTDSNGHGIVNSNIGLLSLNEDIYAGGYPGQENTTYYLYGNGTFFMNPGGVIEYTGGTLFEFIWRNQYGADPIYKSLAYIGSYTLRPVINLKTDTMVISGFGTSSLPYIIQ